MKVYDYRGKLGEYQLASIGLTRQLLVHPDGRRLLLLADRHLLYVDVRGP